MTYRFWSSLFALGAGFIVFQSPAIWAEAPPLSVIAKQSLESNIVRFPTGRSYLRAGSHQFGSLWTRDFCFSVKALLGLGEKQTVRDQLTFLIEHRRTRDNLIPRGVDSLNPSLRTFWSLVQNSFFKSPPPLNEKKFKCEYVGEHRTAAMDGNILVLKAALDYVEATGDTKWWDQQAAAFLDVHRYYLKHFKDGLIQQIPFSDWQDSVKRKGATFYLNLLYLTTTTRLISKDARFADFPISMSQLESNIYKNFYDSASGLFRAVALNNRNQISLDGNLLAHDLGFFKSYQDGYNHYLRLKNSQLWAESTTSFPGAVTFPDYPTSSVATFPRLVGLRHYHDRFYWSWLMAMAGKISYLYGDKGEGDRILNKLSELAVRDNAIEEIYEPQLSFKPVSTYFYKAETPFSWGAASVLEALNQKNK